MKDLAAKELIEQKIYLIRGHKVMLDKDLAILYGVETRVLNQAVRRNIKRFPGDFSFQLKKEEMKNWVSQFVIPNRAKMGMRIRPLAFTEQGVAMLSSVLKSEKAIQVNVAIMRAFVKLRKILTTHKDLAYKMGEIERETVKNSEDIQLIFQAIQTLLKEEKKPKRKIGFH